eukprot:scaffold45323_cov28-Tisochrysis_lutea.AAC.4
MPVSSRTMGSSEHRRAPRRGHQKRSRRKVACIPHWHKGVSACGGASVSKPQPACSPFTSITAHHHLAFSQTAGCPQWQSGGVAGGGRTEGSKMQA